MYVCVCVCVCVWYLAILGFAVVEPALAMIGQASKYQAARSSYLT
jgi:hypothetical protein